MTTMIKKFVRWLDAPRRADRAEAEARLLRSLLEKTCAELEAIAAERNRLKAAADPEHGRH
jgi:hypothetical protein